MGATQEEIQLTRRQSYWTRRRASLGRPHRGKCLSLPCTFGKLTHEQSLPAVIRIGAGSRSDESVAASVKVSTGDVDDSIPEEKQLTRRQIFDYPGDAPEQ